MKTIIFPLRLLRMMLRINSQSFVNVEDNSKGCTQTIGGSPGDVSEEPVTEEKRKKGWSMNCDLGEATE